MKKGSGFLEMKNRADRLFQERNKKEKIKKIIKETWGDSQKMKESILNDPKFIGKMAHTPHPCSRHCCGNARKWAGKTLQEIKKDIDDDIIDENDY